MIEWSPEQQRAITTVAEWLQDRHQPIFRLFGYAGTGKTTLARHMASQADGRIYFAAFTGKAALVLQEKGCPNASTIHSLIYKPVLKDSARLENLEAELLTLKEEAGEQTDESININLRTAIEELTVAIEQEKQSLAKASFVLNDESDLRGASLLVVDECSMVDEKMAKDLMSFGTPILVLGDPGQLPPIHGTGYFTSGKPDFMLTGIHRQAADNPIIQLATQVRTGQRIPMGRYGESVVASRRKLDPAGLIRMDQVLVGRNIIRRELNKKMRKQLGFVGWYPQTEDKLVCLRNNRELGWFNGSQFTLFEGLSEAPDPKQTFHIQVEEHRGAHVHPEPFLGEDIPNDMPWWERNNAEEFDYGYAMTVHKSQGSQWDRVCLLDESFCFRGSEQKWLYTGITRAAKRIVILR